MSVLRRCMWLPTLLTRIGSIDNLCIFRLTNIGAVSGLDVSVLYILI